MNTEKAVARLTEVIRRKHLALATERSYCAWLRRYCDNLKGLPAHLSSEQKLERFLNALAQENVAASTQNQAFNAILFFYKEALGVELKNVRALRAKRPAQIGAITATTKFSSDDFRSKVPRFSDENRKSNQAMGDVIARFAAQKCVTPAQVALAWLLAQNPWIVPIPGTTKLHRLQENIGAVDVHLSPEELRELETAASSVAVQGARYPEHLQKLVGR